MIGCPATFSIALNHSARLESAAKLPPILMTKGLGRVSGAATLERDRFKLSHQLG
jgi:hypothetical protein